MSTRAIDTAQDAESRERELTHLVDQWTAHMRWRKNYDRWREDRLWQEDGQARRLRSVANVASSLTGKQVLDIGSGMGGFLVAAKRNGINAVGIEPNDDYCTITRLRAARYDLPPLVLQSVGEALPFPDASFDVVLAQDILEHVHDPMRTLREIRRVLRPDGVALVTVINRFAWRDPHYHLRGLNWIPRRWAEAIVVRVGRSKRGAHFRDNQRLSDMYYDTFAGFQRRAAVLGFAAIDTKEPTPMNSDQWTPDGSHTTIKHILTRFGLLNPVYRVHRFMFASTYEIALRPTRCTQ